MAALEAQYAMKYGESKTFSEQQLLDCTVGLPYRNRGCGGGQVESSLKYAMLNGIVESSAYPYLSQDAKVICVLYVYSFELWSKVI